MIRRKRKSLIRQVVFELAHTRVSDDIGVEAVNLSIGPFVCEREVRIATEQLRARRRNDVNTLRRRIEVIREEAHTREARSIRNAQVKQVLDVLRCEYLRRRPGQLPAKDSGVSLES